jgi:hypothetical protein
MPGDQVRTEILSLGGDEWQATGFSNSKAPHVLWTTFSLMGLDVGVLKADWLADILILEGDPLSDVRLLQDKSRLKLIMKDGQVFKNQLSPSAGGWQA